MLRSRRAAPGELERLRGAAAEAAAAAAAARAPFEWVDGPLVTAMRRGDIILIDELNLAEDAVLERMNRRAPGAPPAPLQSTIRALWVMLLQ